MKLHVRTTEENKAQQFRFKPRAFNIDNILEIDISALGSLASHGSFSEWKEFHSRQVSFEKVSIHCWFSFFCASSDGALLCCISFHLIISLMYFYSCSRILTKNQNQS